MSRIALIDGDVLVYATAWKAEEPIDWGDGTTTLEVNHEAIAAHIDERICDIEADVESDRTVICLSSPHLYRTELFPEYKANRRGEGKRKPIGYKAAREYFEKNFECVQRPGLEADDVMGILATADHILPEEERVICSVDKDMLQVPGLHYQWNKAENGVFEVGWTSADYKFWQQILAGDATDNIRGIPGIGPKRADKMLMESVERHSGWNEKQGWYDVVLPAYEKAGLTEADALLTARLVKILQAEDYDFDKKEPILWTP